MTKKRIVKTGTERLLASMRQHWTQPLAGKCVFDAEQLASIETMAKELGIQPITEDVPEPKTNGELLYEAAKPHTICGVLGAADDVAAEFLRLLRERDGEPLDVTKEIIADWYMEWRADQDTPRQSEWFVFLTAKINAHRGVRPVPQVTAEMCREAVHVCWKNIPDYSPSDMADYLNDKLAEGK